MAGADRVWIESNGDVSRTLNLMARTARQAQRDPEVRAVAEQIIGAEQSYYGQARAIHDWVVRNVKYTPDPFYREAIKPPRLLLAQPYGDCDDIATLTAALLGSIGYDVQFQAVGFGEPGLYQHVFTQVMIGPEFITSDATPERDRNGYFTRNYSFGEEPPGISGIRKTRRV
jgi:hypothetical protein